MRRFPLLLAVAAVALSAPAIAVGDEPAAVGVAPADDGYVSPPCDDPNVSTLAVVDCIGVEPVPSLDPDYTENPPSVASLTVAAAGRAATQPSFSELPAYCRLHAQVYFYTASDWLRLGQKLQANASACADYYISIPPLADDKTALRCPQNRDQQDDLIRALGPRFHPVAEFHFQGWRNWWRAAGKTPVDAAHAFLAKVRDCGYDFSRGETWSVNELHSGIAANNPGARAEMRALQRPARRRPGDACLTRDRLGDRRRPTDDEPERLQGLPSGVAPGLRVLAGHGERRLGLGSGGVSQHA